MTVLSNAPCRHGLVQETMGRACVDAARPFLSPLRSKAGDVDQSFGSKDARSWAWGRHFVGRDG